MSIYAGILDKNAINNRANQLNANQVPSGPGRPARYRGTGKKLDLDNHTNQLNTNCPTFELSD